ncbi:LacI family DNA-binding transcriptional regulator [Streptomyces sp. NRRL WC-3742]|uniref:LacI family DNA-binding transcriptional regulator n=1 Tax=Streptomyces sp. NRRL WC-3742 TaxID=1463934 RepID=UPI00055B8C45|nr:LacI family DNA-binding transcriptional regulator [Streptomyces sp. NRRL WC-3742]
MATSEDVARLAGVSQATVSRTFSGSARVSEATRAKVEAAATALGYVPDAAAQSLVTATSRTIALNAFGNEALLSLLSRPDLYFYIGVLRALQEHAALAGYDLLMPSTPDRPDRSDGAGYIRRLRSRKVAGVISLGAPLDTRRQALLESGMPTVFIDAAGSGPRATHVSSDNVDGARQAVRHLLELGHRKIARIAVPETVLPGRDRAAGARAALADAGVLEDPRLVVPSDWTPEGAYDATTILLAGGVEFTAVVAESDIEAFAVIHALTDHRRRVPEDVSVIGFDDLDLCTLMRPALTTVHQDVHRIGARAVEALLHTIEQGGAPDPIVVPARLVVRDSTAPPPAASGITSAASA